MPALVAKSYIGLEQVGNIYIANGKQYINVRMSNGNLKAVRAYTEAEYKKFYPDIKIDPYSKSLAEVLGFKDGYITIFKGNTYENKDWFHYNGATYTRYWGWSFASDVDIPEDLPEDVSPIRLNWSDVSNGELLKKDDEIKKAIDALTYEDNGSEYIGEEGERLDLYLHIEKVNSYENSYGGVSICYTMYDDNGNTFNWFTSSGTKTTLEEDADYHLRGTVKKHDLYKGNKTTILTRVNIVKE